MELVGTGMSIMLDNASLCLEIEKSSNVGFWLRHFRHWLRYMENKLKEAERSDSNVCLGSDYIEERLFEQLVFQKALERDGAVLVAAIRKKEREQVWPTTTGGSRTCADQDVLRCKSSCLERRWHDLWLKSLERQCRLEQQLHSVRLGLSNVLIETVDRSEPTAKRRRLDYFGRGQSADQNQATTRASSVTSDTIPFAEDEYESIMERASPPVLDDNGNVLEVDEGGRTPASEPAPVRDSDGDSDKETGFDRFAAIGDIGGVQSSKNVGDTSVPDVGYSSENSAHFSNNEDDHVSHSCSTPCRDERPQESGGETQRKHLDLLLTDKRFKNYCRTTALDTDGTTDTDTPRQAVPSPWAFRTDSQSAQPNANDFAIRSHSKSPRLNDSFSAASPGPDDSTEDCRDFDEIIDLLENGDQCHRESAGTLWKPLAPHISTYASCDASSEMSTDEARNDENRFSSSKTLLQGSSDLQTVTTPVAGSLKKRRKRNADRSTIWTKPYLAFASETAIMSTSFSSSATAASPSINSSMQLGHSDIPWIMTSSMSSSGYGGCGTGSELRAIGWKMRKKARPRRMPRSMSDGEHLSFLSRRYFSSSGVDVRRRRDTDEAVLTRDESADHYRRHSELETPSAPRATPISDSNDGGDEGRVFDSIRELDDLLHDEYISVTNGRGGGGEAMAMHDEVGDDGERTAGDGGSTVSGADQWEWEWDEYKPHHNENGPADQPALDDSNLTAFGDDYRAYLGHMSDSCNSATCSGARLHPIGRSHDSDSELEEIFNKIKESQIQLRLTQNAFQKQRSPTVAPTFADILANCEKNVKGLESILDGGRRRGFSAALPSSRKSSTKETNDFAVAAGLLCDWRNLTQSVKAYIDSASKPATFALMARTRASEKEERFSQLLQQEMRRLGSSLKQIMAQGAPRSSVASGFGGTDSYGSLDSIKEDLDLLKTMQLQLMAEQGRLDTVIRGFKMSSRCKSIGEEVQQLSAAFEQARLNFDKQLREMELLLRNWSQWQESERLCLQLLSNIRSKLDQCEPQSLFNNFSNRTDGASSCFEALQSELYKLEERVLRLEILFNKLSRQGRAESSVASAPLVDESALINLRDRTASMRRELDALRAKMRESEQEVPLTNLEIIAASAGIRKTVRLIDANGSCNEPKKASDKSEKTNVDEAGRLAAARHIFFRYWPIQLCLLILLILDVVLFYPACCEHVNRYWWTFGPKTYYSHGPPPT